MISMIDSYLRPPGSLLLFSKMPQGRAVRAPYFHNGSAATLMDAVNFYDTRFTLHLSEQDKNDLVAFLKTL